MLHIANLEVTTRYLRRGGVSGKFIVWQDILYEGPVTNGCDLDQFVAKRRVFYHSLLGHWGQSIADSLVKRNKLFYSFADFDEVILWFGDTVADQLQLVQLLHWFSFHDMGSTRLSVVNVDRNPYLVNEDAAMNVRWIARLMGSRVEVTVGQFMVACQAWSAYVSSCPRGLVELYQNDLSSLSFLKFAIRRILNQYPSNLNGLCKTEKNILELLVIRDYALQEVYQVVVHSRDGLMLMRYEVFCHYLFSMIHAEAALLTVINDQQSWDAITVLDLIENPPLNLSITALGKEVLYNHVDWVRITDINRWVGGVHLTGDNIWRWNTVSQVLANTYV